MKSLDRYYAWRRRLYTPVAELSLGFGDELWGELREHPAYEHVARIWKEDNDSTIRFHLTTLLLDDVAHAAGGIEYTTEKIKTSLKNAQARLEEANLFLSGPEPVGGNHFGDVSVDYASFEFANLLTWTRALEERLDRRVPKSSMRLGLLPALAPNTTLTPRVRLAVNRLREALDGTRYLANFVAHASAIPYAGAAARVVNGRIIVKIPDPPKEPIEISHQLTYKGGRDLESFADDILAAVEVFMDELLSAFEDAARVRRAEPDKFFVGELPEWAKRRPS